MRSNSTLFAAIFLAFFCQLLFAAQPKLTSVETSSDSITLLFSSDISHSSIKSFILQDKNPPAHRYAFDFKAELATKKIPKEFVGLDGLKVGQFDKKTVRVVLKSTKKLDCLLKVDGKKITIKIDGVTVKKEAEAKKPNSQKSESTAVQSRAVEANESAAGLFLAITSEAAKKEPQKPKTQIKNESANESEEPSKEAIFPKDRHKKIVVIDPGHGGKDSGALGCGGKQEKDIVYKIAQLSKLLMEKKGFTVYLTRNDDIFIELTDRTKFANEKHADLFVSIHANAVDGSNGELSRAKGLETYFLSPARSEKAKKAAQKENVVETASMDFFAKETFLNFLNREKIVQSNKFAIDAQRGILANLRSKYPDVVDNGVREAPFWVLVGALMPAILVETGYITHPTECVRLQDNLYETLLAKGIVDGVESYFVNN